MSMMTIRELLLTKDVKEVWSVAPHIPVQEALTLMGQKDIGAVPVMDKSRLVGIFSERDYAREIVRMDQVPLETPVREFMTTEVISVSPDSTVEECMAVMTDNHIRHLPVLNDKHLIGIVSIGDIVKSIITAQEKIIARLENYIIGVDFVEL